MKASLPIRYVAAIVFLAMSAGFAAAQPFVAREKLAQTYFGNDAPWFLANIPFLDIDDAAIERTYYYRWQLYRSHIREIGPQGTDETEFLADVPWARHPFEDLNDSSSFHILEGRWLRNPDYGRSLVDHLYAGGGNDRHFSESIASAMYAWTQVTGDPAPAIAHLDAMQHVFNLWDDHFDAQRGLYWIEPLLDATEYTVGSIDASGAGFSDHPETGRDGFFGGFAFRPSINAYQFGNAQAIAALATIAGQKDVADAYTHRAEALRQATLQQLWNPKLEHFTDIYQRSTKTVKAGEFIRGRELVGLVPWQFELPPQHPQSAAPKYEEAWKHVLSPAELAGPHGLRTAEPSYARYLTQYRYDKDTGQPECQWNGPSWPFQTSQTLSGLANLLHDYEHPGVNAGDYVHLLRQYTAQHRLASGVLDLQEDYNPDTGQPIVGLPRSHHYNHSTYIDLVLTGLLGIKPRTDSVLELDPLLPGSLSAEAPIRYFALDRLRYHGHDLTIVYDVDGKHYGVRAGMTVYSDGKRILDGAPLGHVTVRVLPTTNTTAAPHKMPIDLAVNVWASAPTEFQPDLPIATASSTAEDTNLYDPLDGRLWFFPEIAHGWSPAVASGKPKDDWYAVDLRKEQIIGSLDLAFFADGKAFAAPAIVRVEKFSGTVWTALHPKHAVTPIANGITHIEFAPVQARQLRVTLTPPANGLRERLISLRVFGP